MPAAQKGSLALTILEFPLASEKGARFQSWPEIVTEIWDRPPVRDSNDTRWDHRIQQLIAAVQKGQADRKHATLQLAYVAMQDALKPEEAIAFGRALWSDADARENALPQNTNLLSSTFLRLPAAEGIDVRARLTARLFDGDLREVMRLRTPADTAEIGTRIERLSSLANAAERGLTIPASVAVRMFDEIVIWEPQTIDRQDPFATSFVKRFNDDMGLTAGHLLTMGVVPALSAAERTEQRARNLMGFATRTRSWTSLGALPLFWTSAQGARNEIISIIRRGLIGSESQHVGNAALAIISWAKLVRNGTVPDLPRALVEQLIVTVEACRENGLSTMLGAARTLLKDDFLREEDLQRLMQSLSMIRSEFRYENVEFDTMRAVTVSLVRAECVKLAAALKGRVVDDGTLQGWDDEAQSDPLPEVRFALAED